MWDFIHRYESKVEFSKEGRDLSLNFVKGICILLVLLNHTTDDVFKHDSWFFVWGYPAVPLFLLIQTFHSYKKGFSGFSLRLGKIWSRAVFPFLVVEVILFVYTVVRYPTVPIRQLLMSAFYWGGWGPGSYYPWIFFQFAILLPLLRPLFRHLGEKPLLILFMGLSVGCELLCYYSHMLDWLYRLLLLRYLFLIYLGYQLVLRGIVLNILTITLSVISIIAVYCFEFRIFDFTPYFYESKDWATCHWICYFYIAYPLLYILCKVFYWLPPQNVIENVFCKMGEHSYAIFIFQLFYFYVLAPMVLDGVSNMENTVLCTIIYILVAILVCVVPVVYFVSGLSNWAIFFKIGVMLLVVACVITFVRWKWHPYYVPPALVCPYEVKHSDDDTLRVIMIGDSWVYFHETLRRDSTFEDELKKRLGSGKVKVTAKGKAGSTSGEIYQRMSAERTWEMDYDLNYCTQSVIEAGADYCVISAGINDARQRRGKIYYVGSYLKILRLLLSYGIRPVVTEVPNVEVDESFNGNTFYYRMKARISMSILETELYGVGDYRRTLKDSLISTHLMDSVLYISADSWNPEGWRDKRDIYTDDHFHLNLAGYEILDSTFAAEIVNDYRIRKKR